MTDRNDTIDASSLGDRSQADAAFPNGTQRYRNHGSNGGRRTGDNNAGTLRSNDSQCESLVAIMSDVEEFSRGWIGRIRQLIHRSSQLIERESLLAGAIARLDQQKAEWTTRIASKEEGLRDQAKHLTEAWLEVESERRKAIQGARAAATGSNKSNSVPVVAAPVQPVAGTQSVQQPVAASTTPKAAAASTPVSARATGGLSKMPPAPLSVNVPVQNGALPGCVQVVARRAPVPNAPVTAGHLPTTGEQTVSVEDFAHAEAAKRRKIEEFKRMQRAIRSNQNK